jgi:hypothetical protein
MNGHGYICVGWRVLKGILLYNRMLYTHILEGFILWLLTLRLLHHQYLFSSSFYSHSRNRLDRLTLDNSISGPTANASAQVVYSTAASNRATQSNALVRYGNLRREIIQYSHAQEAGGISWKPIVSLFASWGRFDLFTRHLDIYRFTVAEWTGKSN